MGASLGGLTSFEHHRCAPSRSPCPTLCMLAYTYCTLPALACSLCHPHEFADAAARHLHWQFSKLGARSGVGKLSLTVFNYFLTLEFSVTLIKHELSVTTSSLVKHQLSGTTSTYL